jgi:uncharacterized cupin superfamily protein
MERVALEAVDSLLGPAAVKRPVSRALGASNVAVNFYELAPGDAFGAGYHRHPNQEELFFVLSGTATFETEAGEVEVGPEELVRFAPGEWQVGRNAGEERVRALAIGAPQESPEAEVLRECPACGEATEQTFEMTDDKSALLAVCAVCGTETARYT